jgi:TonB family protein
MSPTKVTPLRASPRPSVWVALSLALLLAAPHVAAGDVVDETQGSEGVQVGVPFVVPPGPQGTIALALRNVDGDVVAFVDDGAHGAADRAQDECCVGARLQLRTDAGARWSDVQRVMRRLRPSSFSIVLPGGASLAWPPPPDALVAYDRPPPSTAPLVVVVHETAAHELFVFDGGANAAPARRRVAIAQFDRPLSIADITRTVVSLQRTGAAVYVECDCRNVPRGGLADPVILRSPRIEGFVPRSPHTLASPATVEGQSVSAATKTLPASATPRTVKLLLYVSQTGVVRHAEVVAPSGDEALDQAVRRVARSFVVRAATAPPLGCVVSPTEPCRAQPVDAFAMMQVELARQP